MIPKKLRILGKTYTVEITPGITEYGLCCEETQTIKIRPVKGGDVVKDTLLHECIHAIDFSMHSGLTEDQVQRLGSGLWALFNDNPELLAYLMAANKKAPRREPRG